MGQSNTWRKGSLPGQEKASGEAQTATHSPSFFLILKAFSEEANTSQIPSSPCLHPSSSAPDLLGPQLINTSSSGGIHQH